MMNHEFTIVYFSKDRPLQLDLAINTNWFCCKEIGDVDEYVLYKASSPEFEEAYMELANEHPFVGFLKESNFKEDLLYILEGYKYVMFVVDDTVFVRDYSVEKIIDELNDYKGAIGFSLRLGKNTIICYPTGARNEIPDFGYADEDESMLMFNWNSVKGGDFAYPLELSSSVYRVKDLISLLNKLPFKNPNELEWQLYSNIDRFQHILLCYEYSRAFSNPLNKVQNTNNNRCNTNPMYSPENLLKEFCAGKRINRLSFYGFFPKGCHQEVDIVLEDKEEYK